MKSAPRLAGVLLVAVVVTLRSQEGADLPDQEAFFAATQQNLIASGRVQYEFAYKERRTELHTNPFGRLGTGEDLLYEVIPLTDSEGYTRRLVARAGEPVEDAEVERVERRPRREPREGPRRRSSTEDVLAVLDFEMDRREVFDGRPAIVIRFRPKPGAEATTRQGRVARAFSGEAWVDEEAREVRHVEATSVDTVSYGWGVLARLGKGATASLEREPVADGVWMPTSVRLQGRGRALFWIRQLTIDYEISWFDYRRSTPG